MQYILALDQGTSSSRAAIYTDKAELICSSQHSTQSFYPQPGWVEQNPEDLWKSIKQALLDVTSKVDIDKIACCGITNQRETTVVWDKRTGQCLGPAIVWQDRRTEAFCQALSASKTTIKNKTGLILDPYFSATKLHWILQNNSEALTLAQSGYLAFGTVDSYLMWQLSGGKIHRTDVTNASRTMLYNIQTLSWDKDLLDLFKIPKSVLPEVCSSDAYFADFDPSILGKAIPITGVAGDQQASLIGQSCFEPGMIKATFGTGGFLLLNTGEQIVDSDHHLLATVGYQIKGKTIYGLEGSIYHAGTTMKWLRDELKLFSDFDETERMAASISSNEGVYLISSFTGLGAPYWLSKPGGSLIGLSLESRPEHIVRAAMEGLCYQVQDVMNCMEADSHIQFDTMRVDGGMSANNWFLQFLANQCDLSVQKPANLETTLFGAAMLAAIGAGVYADLEQLSEQWVCDQALSREEGITNYERNYAGWKKALKMLAILT